MELAEFTGALARLDADGIRRLDAAITAAHFTATDEVDSWRVTMAIEKALRQEKKSREAARAAFAATQAILVAASAAHIELPNDSVTRVARYGAELARGVVAGQSVECEVKYLFRLWEALLPLGA